MPFKLSHKLKKKYDQIFRENPIAASTFLLLAELADKRGQVVTNENDLVILMNARVEDPRGYSI